MDPNAPPPSQAGSPTPAECTTAMLAHLLTFTGYIVLFHFLAPLIIYLMKKNESAFIADQARESVNFQFTCWIAALFGILLCFTGIGACVGIPYLLVLAVSHFVFVIIAAIRARDGISYRYPYALRLF